jgi:nucleotide-binding universal stress UspA family protein
MTNVAGAAVVVGVDGSPSGWLAVEAAAAQAAARHRPLRIVHALVWPAIPVVVPPGMSEAAPELIRELARGYLSEAAILAGKTAPDIPVAVELVTGRPGVVLADESRRADLLVVGERGMGGLLLGSVAVHVAAHAECPVLVVRGEPRSTGPVVVGVDGTAESARALEFALQEASLRGAPLVALHAWSGRDHTELDRSVPAPRAFWSDDAQERRVLAESLAGAGERYPEVPVRRQVVRGHAGRLLSEWSQSAQLIVVGDRGHGGLTGLMAGSVSQHLIFHAACPVAVVRFGTGAA